MAQLDLVVHSTHEAGIKLGGIGAVLDGLLTQAAYNDAVKRTILIGADQYGRRFGNVAPFCLP